ncbi:SUKH-3 domain-containing protein [Cryptosporangium sp. NPDC048952]|uniref:SUKH-3 domain-containing protein n=1 Tax=Cryptosporangium sp. NPDC048952 TaxID=3363961 RepID=UPI00371DBD84
METGRGDRAREGVAIVSREEAVELASRWLGVPGDSVELREFDQGWVGWRGVPDVAPGVLPERVGDARVVVDRDSGAVSSWPPLPVEEIIARSRPAEAGRFPADVEGLLRKAGWYPGRTLPDADLDRYAERLHALTVDDPPILGLVDVAEAVLREFGGLTIDRPNWTTWQLQPAAVDPDIDLVGGLGETLDQPVTPIGSVVSPFEVEIIMSADGRVFYGGGPGHSHYLVAHNFNWAVVRAIYGQDRTLPWVARSGDVVYEDSAGRAIDPGSTRGPLGAEGLDVAEEAEDAADQGHDG